MSLKGSIPYACMILRRRAVMARTGSFWVKHEPTSAAENAFRGLLGDRRVRGPSTALSIASRTTTAHRVKRKTCDEDGYRFLAEFRLGATMGLLTGTIAPFDGSPAALALVSTSS